MEDKGHKVAVQRALDPRGCTDGSEMILYILHFNHDYNEWTEVYRTYDEAFGAMAQAFEVDPESPSVWFDAQDAYEHDNWKGFTFQTLNTETLEITDVRADTDE